eukprot:1185584-Prorocentrum_minimum.AAC.5
MWQALLHPPTQGKIDNHRMSIVVVPEGNVVNQVRTRLLLRGRLSVTLLPFTGPPVPITVTVHSTPRSPLTQRLGVTGRPQPGQADNLRSDDGGGRLPRAPHQAALPAGRHGGPPGGAASQEEPRRLRLHLLHGAHGAVHLAGMTSNGC